MDVQLFPTALSGRLCPLIAKTNSIPGTRRQKTRTRVKNSITCANFVCEKWHRARDWVICYGAVCREILSDCIGALALTTPSIHGTMQGAR